MLWRASRRPGPSSRRAARHGPDATSIGERHGLAAGHGIQRIVIAFDEIALLLPVELARDDLRPAICEAKAVQQRDQTRAAFLGKAEFHPDPGADLARRTWANAAAAQAFSLSCCSPLIRAKRCRSAIEMQQPVETILQKHAMPPANGVIIQKPGGSGFPATPTGIEKHQRIGSARANRCSAEPSRGLGDRAGTVFN